MAQQANLLKIGWLRSRSGSARPAPMRVLAGVLGLVAAATIANVGTSAANAAPRAAPRILFAGGNWAAIDFGARCEARSGAMWARNDTEPFAGFAFDRAGQRQGQFYVHLSRPPRSGATVVATVGSTPFLLVAKGQWAWSRGARQQKAMIAAARRASAMRIESRDQRGRRIVDRYALAGAPTAIDSAAAACAGKRR